MTRFAPARGRVFQSPAILRKEKLGKVEKLLAGANDKGETMNPKTVQVNCKTCNKAMQKPVQKLAGWQGNCQKCSRNTLRAVPIRAAWGR